MKKHGIVSETRRRTKGGSLPGRRFEPAHCDGFNPNRNGAARSSKEGQISPISTFLQNAISQLFAFEYRMDGDFRLEADPHFAPRTASNANNGDQRFSPQDRKSEDVAPLAVADQLDARLPRWKRVFDLICVLLTLPIWLPLTVLVMALIKIASPGPVFFKQERIGYRGKRFMIFKFRSMRVNADTKTHEEHVERLMRADCPMTKLDHADPRLIPAGRILRATGLDELPQIFNIIRGDMSLVGPRPCTSLEFERYQNWQQERVNAPPGITGYWQVNGKNKTTFGEMIEMDIFYARNMSVWLDLVILVMTPTAVLRQTFESSSFWGGGKVVRRENLSGRGLKGSIGET